MQDKDVEVYRFQLHKLIRDRLPQMMRSEGITVHDRVMGDEEYKTCLKEKMVEEAQEVAASTNQKDLCAECGDVLEVMISLLHVYGLTLDDVRAVADQKKKANGGFVDRIYVSCVDVPENSKSLSYFQKYRSSD